MHIGVDNKGAGTVDATENCWGCPQGPDKGGCTTVSGAVSFTPWLRHPTPKVNAPWDDEKEDQRDDGRNEAE